MMSKREAEIQSWRDTIMGVLNGLSTKLPFMEWHEVEPYIYSILAYYELLAELESEKDGVENG